MRKDLRIGLGIGGVLLAVLIVSLVVRSNNNKKQAEQAIAEDVEPGDGANPYGEDPMVTPDPSAPAANGLADGGPPVMPPLPPVDGAAANDAEDGVDPFAPPDASVAAAPAGTPRDWNYILASDRSGNPPPAAPRGAAPAPDRGSDAAPAPEPSPSQPNARVARTDAAGTAPVGMSIFTGSRTPGQRTHVVKSGETLISIARAQYGNPRHYLHILKANPSVDPETMRPGTRLVLPDLSSLPAPRRSGNGGGVSSGPAGAFEAAAAGANAGLRPVDPKMEYRIQSGDSLARISQRLYGSETKVDALYNANRDAIGPDREKLKLGVVLRLPEPPTTTALR